MLSTVPLLDTNDGNNADHMAQTVGTLLLGLRRALTRTLNETAVSPLGLVVSYDDWLPHQLMLSLILIETCGELTNLDSAVQQSLKDLALLHLQRTSQRSLQLNESKAKLQRALDVIQRTDGELVAVEKSLNSMHTVIGFKVNIFKELDLNKQKEKLHARKQAVMSHMEHLQRTLASQQHQADSINEREACSRTERFMTDLESVLTCFSSVLVGTDTTSAAPASDVFALSQKVLYAVSAKKPEEQSSALLHELRTAATTALRKLRNLQSQLNESTTGTVVNQNTAIMIL
jgi:hypothetical protein